MNNYTDMPHKAGEVSIPESLFSQLLPTIDDANELKLILYVLYLIHQKKSIPQLITYQELSKNDVIGSITQKMGRTASEALSHALETALQEDILLHLSLDIENGKKDVYFLNNAASKKAASEKINLNDIICQEIEIDAEKKANIFTLYEQNIGLLSPMIAEKLKEAEETYPASWIEGAFGEAVDLNKRSWRYISKILERWSSEGRGHGTSGGYNKKDDPDKYIKGKYGRIVKR